jgi:hypothetical protein
MVLFYRQEQSIRQVAADLGVSEDAAKQRLSRGRKLLKKEVASLVEDVIGRTRPSKVFTIAVIAALPAVAPQVASAAIAATVAKGSAAAKSAWLLSMVGALLGPLLGLYGASIGFRASIANAKSPRERRFITRMLWFGLAYFVVWITVCTILLWMRIRLKMEVLPMGTVFLVFLLGFPAWAFWNRRRLKHIQKDEGTYVKPEHRVLEMSKGHIIGAYSGSVYGSLLWLYMTAYKAKDWLVLMVIVIAGVLIVGLATKLCLRARRDLYRIASGVCLAVGAINLLVINLRWEVWIASFKESGRHLKYTRVSLWQINLVMAAVMVVLLLIFLVSDVRHRRISKPEQNAHAD